MIRRNGEYEFVSGGQLPPDFNTQESNEMMREKLETIIRKAFLNGYKINEGDNAVIYRLDINAEGFREAVADVNDGVVPEDAVSKLLKINKANLAQQEYEMQSMAYNTLQKYRKTGIEYAEIPKPFMCEELKVDADLKERLDHTGVRREEGENVEVIVMDEIKGLDALRYMHEAVAKIHPSLESLRKVNPETGNIELDSVNRNELDIAVQSALGYKRLENAGRVGAAAKQTMLDAENKKMMISYLSRHDFKFPKGFFEKINNTMSLLHEHGIYHRDLHERNIMLDHEGKVWIIDFGTGVVKEKGEDAYEAEDGKHYKNDSTFSEMYRSLGENIEKKSMATEIQPMIDRVGVKFPDVAGAMSEFEGAAEKFSDAAGIKQAVDSFLVKYKQVKNIPEVSAKMIYNALGSVTDKEKLKVIITDLIRLYPRDFSNKYLVPMSKELL